MGDATIEDFRRAYEQGLEAFNRRDLDSALAVLSAEFEFEPIRGGPSAEVIRGREAVIEAYADFFEVFPDWHAKAREYIDAGGGTFIVRIATSGTGTGAGTPVADETFQVWDTKGGVPVRLREFRERDEALDAAGLSK